jgi:hypothetical protein
MQTDLTESSAYISAVLQHSGKILELYLNKVSGIQ